jgi:hypothetical protein
MLRLRSRMNWLAALALQNKRLLDGLLFQATAESLQSIAADPKRLGGNLGFFAVLHTWGQTFTLKLTHDAVHYHLLRFQRTKKG